jgi:sortase A
MRLRRKQGVCLTRQALLGLSNKITAVQEEGFTMRVVATILIIAGLIIGIYPLLDKAYTWYLEYQLTEEYITALTQEDTIPVTTDALDEFEQLQLIFEEEVMMDPEEAEEDQTAGKASDKKASPRFNRLGRIEIPKIEVSIPIVEGTGKAHLKVGAGHITGTSELGSIGNTALAAHRSHTYGKMFNRLDELEIGDSITITTDQGVYEYTVYEFLVVSPDDVSVLYHNNQERILTLITCTPLYTATHRLVVHAVMR